MHSKAAHDQVKRILESNTFATKLQLKKLLEILLDNIESQSNLTPDRVIRELWPSETRTKRSADVATEMNRLRHALDAYYDAEGANDAWKIELPNRAAAATNGNGNHHKVWIVLKPREPESETTVDAEPAPEAPQQLRRVSRATKIRAAVVAACILAALVFWTSRRFVLPDQPAKGKLEGSALVIMDAEGKELWRKTFAGGFGPESYYGKDTGERIWFADLEGHRHTSVLFSYLPAATSEPHSSVLICYSDRGNEKWRWTPGTTFPNSPNQLTFRTMSVGVLKPTEARPLRIAALSDHEPWWGGPSQVALIDSNGKMLSEYWQAGGLHDLLVASLKRDSAENILLTGVANGYTSQATLVVLDPDHMAGASNEENPAFQVHGMGTAQEKLRLLFQRSDFNAASFAFNYATEPRTENGNLWLTVMECLAPIGCPIRYRFDNNFDLTAIDSASEEFRSAHDRFYKPGKKPHVLSENEGAEFLKIRCRNGCDSEFVRLAQADNPSESFATGWTARLNPDGVWSYGYSTGPAGAITLYDKPLQNGINGPNSLYWVSSTTNTGTSPAAQFNNGPPIDDGNIDFNANEFLLVAGIEGQYSDLVFTVPADGNYSLSGSFRGAQYGVGTIVGITVNGKVELSSRVTSVNQIIPFQSSLRLRSGNKVTFFAGPGGGRQNTGLSVTVTRPCAGSEKPTVSHVGAVVCGARPMGD